MSYVGNEPIPVVALPDDIVVADDLIFTGTGNRITGDFSNATVANRVMFQTSTVNGNTSIAAIPSGIATVSNWAVYNSQDVTNASLAYLAINSSTVDLVSNKSATGGAYLPMTFYTGGAERMRIDTSGGVTVTSAAGLGYGTGAGGTVTQLTSKSTPVTLNKPTGRITTASGSIAANGIVQFPLNNSLIASSDQVLVNQAGFSIDTAAYQYFVGSVTSGQCVITIRNMTASPLDSVIPINFAIIKGSAS